MGRRGGFLEADWRLNKKWDVVKDGDGGGRGKWGGGKGKEDSFGAISGEAGGGGGVAADTGVMGEIGLWGGNEGSGHVAEEVLEVEDGEWLGTGRTDEGDGCGRRGGEV